jgi:uncharacterized protein YndB with AHSA1/START domain
MNAPLPAVEHRVRVALPPPQAFELFTRQITRWWPFRGHSCFDDAAAGLAIEERVGGSVTETSRSGEQMTWGTLTEWAPPRAFAMRWHPGLPPAEATLLRVSFSAAPGGGTDVAVHHSGWEARGAAATGKREQYEGGWPETLAAFTSLAAQPAWWSAR